jgi:hypothetical protein
VIFDSEMAARRYLLLHLFDAVIREFKYLPAGKAYQMIMMLSLINIFITGLSIGKLPLNRHPALCQQF